MITYTENPPVSVKQTNLILQKDDQGAQSVTYQVQLVDSQGKPVHVKSDSGNALPILSTEEKAQLQAIIDRFEALANEKLIP